MKIVINNCFGGFGVNEAVYKELGLEWDGYGYLNNDDLNIKSDNDYAYRADPRFIKAIETIGLEKSSGVYANLKVVEIPDDVDWQIEEYDGIEHIAEQHRTWG